MVRLGANDLRDVEGLAHRLVAAQCVALLTATVAFKLQNRRLAVAVESAGGSWAGLYNSPQYTEIHRLLSAQLTQISWPHDTHWTAHALLATTRVDLVHHLVTDCGMSPELINSEMTAHVERLLRP